MTVELTIFALSFLVMVAAARVLPRALSGIALILHLPEFVVAFVLVAIATSMPELFIGISSSLQGVPALSFGNIFGANLANMTFILGIAAILAKKIPKDGEVSKQNFFFTAVIAFFPLFLAVDGVISRADGLLLLAVYGIYLAKLFRDRHYFHKLLRHNIREPKNLHSRGNVFRQSSVFFASLALLVGSALTLVWSARILTETYLSSNFFLFGIIFLSIGTTLPELTFVIRAALSKHTDAIVGNALGTVAFNAAGVVGIVAMLKPIEYTIGREGVLAGFALFLAFALFYIFMYTGNALRWKEGAALILLYLAFVYLSFF